MKRNFVRVLACSIFVFSGSAIASIVSTSGTVALDNSPYPGPSDTQIFAFNEQQGVIFVNSQTLDYGSIAPGTLVNSHYVQFDPVSQFGTIGAGTITFDGIILGVVTSTEFLDQDLSADGAGTSDSYFGLFDTLGGYPLGADPDARGLGSPDDDLVVGLGTHTLSILSLEIPNNRLTFDNIDGFRVFTSVVPIPAAAWLFGSALGLVVWIIRRKQPGEIR